MRNVKQNKEGDRLVRLVENAEKEQIAALILGSRTEICSLPARRTQFDSISVIIGNSLIIILSVI